MSTIESSLLANLTAGYNAHVRPTISSASPTIVGFDLRLNKIVKLDIKEQELVINGRVMMVWVDPRLKWDKKKHNGTEFLVAPSSLFWLPDILLYNTAFDTSYSATDVYKANLRIDDNGKVTWMSPVTLKSSCNIEVKWFPFDKQSCALTFGSISHTKANLELKFFKQPTSVTDFRGKFSVSSGVWTIKSLTPRLREEKYECCRSKFSLIEFTLSMDRLPLYYVLYLVLPCVCLSFVSLCVFFIPPETGERIGYGITVVLAMSVYLLVISDKLPEKSDQKPIIGVMYTCFFFIMNGSLVAIVFTTHIAFKTTKPPRRICDIFCNGCKRKHRKKKEVAAATSVVVQRGNNGSIELEEHHENREKKGDSSPEFAMHRRRTLVRNSSNLQREFTFLTPEEEKEMENQDLWKEIAERIDRINFWVFFTFTFAIPLISGLAYMA